MAAPDQPEVLFVLMADYSLSGLLIVVAVAFGARLLLGLAPRLRLPAVVLEILAGIAIGPSGLGWVKVDAPIQILSTIGLAFLFFLAGLEIDLRRLRGSSLRLSAGSFSISMVLGLLAGMALKELGQVESPLFVAIVLVSTSLGIVMPALKDAGHGDSDFARLVIGGATIAEFASILLLSLLFSAPGSSAEANLVPVGGFRRLRAGCRTGPDACWAVGEADGRPEQARGHQRSDPGQGRDRFVAGLCGPGR